MKQFTKNMQTMIDYMNNHGGHLYLRPDGLWSNCVVVDREPDFFGPTFNAKVVQRLVDDNLADYTCFYTGNNQEYPIEVRIRNIKFVPQNELLAEARRRGLIK